MTIPILWSGAGAYTGGTATNWLTTELNTLAFSSGNTLSTLGGAFQNTSGWMYFDVEFLSGSTFSPTSGAIELWLLRSLDGTNYEDGSATVAPGRPPDATILIRAGTTITVRSCCPGGEMPAAWYKPLARNNNTVNLPASGNVIRATFYSSIY